jgi:hypothetical protein
VGSKRTSEGRCSRFRYVKWDFIDETDAYKVTGKFRELQRITVPYAKVLGMVDGEDDGEYGDGAMVS